MDFSTVGPAAGGDFGGAFGGGAFGGGAFGGGDFGGRMFGLGRQEMTFSRSVSVGHQVDRELDMFGERRFDIMLPFGGHPGGPKNDLQSSAVQGSNALEKALKTATIEDIVGAEGESSILHHTCRFFNPKETIMVLKIFPEEHLMKKNECGDTALHVACATGGSENIEAILQLVPPSALTEPNDNGSLPLHFLARSGTEDKQLVEKIMDAMPEEALHKRTDQGHSVVHFAAYGTKDIAEAVLSRLGEKSLGWKDSDGVTPLMYACHAAKGETLEFLVGAASAESLGAPEQKFNLLRLLAERVDQNEERNFEEGESADVGAEGRVFERICDVLDLEKMNWSLGNPLGIAAHADAPQTIFKLAVERLPRSALSTPTEEGLTPWHLAATSANWPGGTSEKQDLLAPHLTLEERSSASVHGLNALHCAAASGKLCNVLHLVDPSCALQEDSKGRLPLALLRNSISDEEKDAVAKLIRMTAPALATSSSCVVTAVFERLLMDESLVALLLDSYTDGFLQGLPNTHWPDGESPLHSVASRREGKGSGNDTMEMLLKHFEASVSSPDSLGMTPLWLAALAGKAEMVKLLLPMTKRPLGEKVSIPLNGRPTEMSMTEAMVYFSKVDVLATLLEHDPSLRTAVNKDGKTLLQLVEADEKLKEVQGLLQLLQPSVKAAV